MFITYILPLIATILFLYSAAAYRLKTKKAQQLEEEVRVAEEKEEKEREVEAKEREVIIKEELVINRDTTFNFPPRIQGLIKDYNFIVFKFTDGDRTTPYGRLNDLINCEQLTREELDNLRNYEALLSELRSKAYQGVKPRGYKIFLDIIVGEILQYNLGYLGLTDRNQAAVKIAKHDDNNMYISHIYFSVDLRSEIVRAYPISTKEGEELFKKEILADSSLCTVFDLELERFEQLKKELQKYNQHHRNIKPVEGSSRMEYVQVPSVAKEDEAVDFNNIPVAPQR
jgi:hypothetical protein